MRRRFRRHPPLWFWILIGLAAVVSGRWMLATHQDAPNLSAGPATVVAVVDGNTLEVECANSTPIRVRLLGIRVVDQSAAVEWLAENVRGREARVEFDKRRRASDGAALAYLYLGPTLVNAELIRQGCARHDPYPGDSASHARILREAR